MKKENIIAAILGAKKNNFPVSSPVKTFAPTNIALCKYWGKRNNELNLPVTSSLSISLGEKGAHTELQIIDSPTDQIFLNDTAIAVDSAFGKRLLDFLNLFRNDQLHLSIRIQSNIPIAAGLASSACGFASVVKALNELFNWQLTLQQLSILARLGSGSAARSLWDGFVEWHAGSEENGLDSYAESLNTTWPELCVGLLILNTKAKKISSREAMLRTVNSSSLYSAWPATVERDLTLLKQAIKAHDFNQLGSTAESNALAMHATMLGAWPPVQYSLPQTIEMMQKIWHLREQGLPIYFTQDAGPNLKLLFMKKDLSSVQNNFPEIEVIQPFA